MCGEHLDAEEHLAFLSCMTVVVFLHSLIVPALLLWVITYVGWQQLQLTSFRCSLFAGSGVEAAQRRPAANTGQAPNLC